MYNEQRSRQSKEVILQSRRQLTYDDIILEPQYSECESRTSDKLDTGVTIGNYNLKIPIISANMDCVTDYEMALAMRTNGGLGILHRFYKNIDERRDHIRGYSYLYNEPAIPTIGINDDEFKFLESIMDKLWSPTTICVDVAHAHNKYVGLAIKRILNKFPHLYIIAGNIVTPDAACYLLDYGVKSLKISIGSGSVCSTRLQTGHGAGSALSLLKIRDKVDKSYKDVKLIADGGIRYPGDIVKAIACGANAVMIGRLLAGCLESSAEAIPSLNCKKYRGQSSREFQEHHGKYRDNVTPEGEAINIPYTGPVKNTLDYLMGGLRSGMSYSGVNTLNELREKAILNEISNATYIEGLPHGKLIYNEKNY